MSKILDKLFGQQPSLQPLPEDVDLVPGDGSSQVTVLEKIEQALGEMKE